jgi:LacI family transcriptional regulator
VLAAAQEMGYHPNKLASALVTGRSHAIAFWVSQVRTHYYTEIQYWLQDRLRLDGYDLVIDPLKSRKNDQMEVITEPALQWPYDGIIACDPPFDLEKELVDSTYRNIPVVSLGVFYWKEADHVGVDLQQGTEKALQHILISLKVLHLKPRIAFVAVPDHVAEEPRYSAYIKMMSQKGLTPEFIDVPNFDRAIARTTIKKYINKNGCPGGLFCFNDNMAVGVHRGLRDLGLQMPKDVVLVGCDGIEDTIYHDPAISTIDMGMDQMCETAWTFLLRRIQEPAVSKQTKIMMPKLIIRESSDFKKGKQR